MPSWFYGPNGQAGVHDACPKGWADHPSLIDPQNVPAASEEALVEAAKAFDHDGDGFPGGSKPKEPEPDVFDRAVDAVIGAVKRAGRKVARDGPRK